MGKIRVLIVDDSVVFRTQIRSALESIEGIEVVGTSSNGKIALERLGQLGIDLVTLDLEMPEMGGVETLKEMKRLGFPQKVIVLSSASKRGAEITFEALSEGASDFITKPGSSPGEAAEGRGESTPLPHEKIRNLFIPKIKSLFPQISPAPLAATPASVSPMLDSHFPKVIWDLFRPRVIVMGSSTGGPTALEKIFSLIQTPLSCPILICQHMPPVFTATLAERLQRISGIPAAEGKHGEIIQNNRIYMAPGNFHMSLAAGADGVRIVLDQSPQINSVRPSVDPLFSTAAKIFKSRCFGIILTGMGEDGKVGAIQVKESGGGVMIQNEATCVVFGMPGAVYAARAYDKVNNLEEISKVMSDVARTY
jgi:two-component system chemotaxis response regulator CheB